jgi:hypothetical protein
VRAGVLIAITLLGLEAAWLLIVNLEFVEDAGRAYALRLLAQCDVLQVSNKLMRRKHGIEPPLGASGNNYGKV